MVDVLILFLLPLFIKDRHETKGHQVQIKRQWIFPKTLIVLGIYSSLQEAFEFAGASSQRTQNFMIIDLKKWSQTNLHLEPHDYRISYVNFYLHDQYGHLVPKCRIFPLNNSGHEERGKRVVFAGYVSH